MYLQLYVILLIKLIHLIHLINLTGRLVWTPEMEMLLVNTRRDMEVTFLEGKTRHNILWNRIAETMRGEVHAHVTGKACNYKFKAEKKKWRDVNNNNKTSGRATSHNITCHNEQSHATLQH